MNTKKTCFKCGEEKSLLLFYKHPRMKDGRLNKCIACAKSDVAKRYWEKHDEIRAYEKTRANLPNRVKARKEYSLTEAGKAAHSRACARYAQRHPVKRAAQIKASNAIRDGRLKREPCEVCGSAKAQAHHDDYNKPLDVRWLCTTHHAEWHKSNEPIV